MAGGYNKSLENDRHIAMGMFKQSSGNLFPGRFNINLIKDDLSNFEVIDIQENTLHIVSVRFVVKARPPELRTLIYEIVSDCCPQCGHKLVYDEKQKEFTCGQCTGYPFEEE